MTTLNHTLTEIKTFEADEIETDTAEGVTGIVINLGGEGEVPSSPTKKVVNVNLPHLLKPNFRAIRDGSTLAEIKERGPVIIARGDRLPFRDGAADYVITNNVPVGEGNSYLGPKYRPSEIKRISRRLIKPVRS